MRRLQDAPPSISSSSFKPLTSFFGKALMTPPPVPQITRDDVGFALVAGFYCRALQLLKVSNKGNKQESAVTTGCAILRRAKYNFRICSDWSLNKFTARITLKTYTRHTLLTRRLCETGFSASEANRQQTFVVSAFEQTHQKIVSNSGV